MEEEAGFLTEDGEDRGSPGVPKNGWQEVPYPEEIVGVSNVAINDAVNRFGYVSKKVGRRVRVVGGILNHWSRRNGSWQGKCESDHTDTQIIPNLFEESEMIQEKIMEHKDAILEKAKDRQIGISKRVEGMGLGKGNVSFYLLKQMARSNQLRSGKNKRSRLRR
ncbi:hypothetical protein L6452_19018 [Arctium lappa]|uniref:Uncharacterized protein n=1 Tax=Arctium lappa TaxID=4217 RepID=A0ACB9B8A5_ARCLA|nr:hypothetical protein L6452_19018 [Arctium lappa]